MAIGRAISDGYLRGIAEEAPGVITLNRRAASACVIESSSASSPCQCPAWRPRCCGRAIRCLPGRLRWTQRPQTTLRCKYPWARGWSAPRYRTNHRAASWAFC